MRRFSLRAQGEEAFSMLELMVVIAVMTLLMAFVTPSLVSFSKGSKSSIHELKGFIELSRLKAISLQTDVFIAFADSNFPNETGKGRSYAMFRAAQDIGIASETSAPSSTPSNLLTLEVIQLTEWRSLAQGVIFGMGRDFDVDAKFGEFGTVLDSDYKREFPTRLDNKGDRKLTLPFLAFNEKGRVSVPPFIDAEKLHVGVVEGFINESGERILTKKRFGKSGEIAQGECIAINFYTGRPRIISE